MAMADSRFDQAVQLSSDLGNMVMDSGRTFTEELCLGQEISLWDVVSPSMTLYRFPLLFSSGNSIHSLQDKLKIRFRPYRGLLARFRDAIKFHKKTGNDCDGWPENRQTILFLGFVPNFYRDVLSPVAESLAAKEEFNTVVIEEGSVLTQSSNTSGDIEFQSVWNHWTPDTRETAEKMLSRFKILKTVLLNDKKYIDSLSESFQLSNPLSFKNELIWLFWREFIRLIPLVAVARHILEKHRPSLIISADDADQRCRIYSLTAKAKGIPSLLVQQGLTEKTYPEWRFFSQTAVAAMGAISCDDMISQGVPNEKITVTGHPGFDCFASSSPEQSKQLRATLGVSERHKMILFVSQPYRVGFFDTPGNRREMIKAIFKACSSITDTTLVIKPHPADNKRELKRLFENSQQVVMVDPKLDVVPLVKASDVVITFFSTVALQAIYAGRPVINVAFPGSGGLQIYKESGATWIACSTAEIVEHLQTLTGSSRQDSIATRQGAREQFLRDMVYLLDGLATKRVVKVARSLL